MVNGKGAIVMRVQNRHPFHEHATVMQAKAEAARLAQTIGGDFVVFVPIAVISPAPRTIETPIALSDAQIPFRVEPQRNPACGHAGCRVGERCRSEWPYDERPF